MTTRNKVLLTILLAVIFWAIFGCTPRVTTNSSTRVANDVTVSYLRQSYATYNEEFFRNRLPKDTHIDMSPETDDMATTSCNLEGTGCVLHFNPRYVLASRVADFTMLHEMCHIKTWGPESVKHGRVWRACMMQLDLQGAFRDIIIDRYWEDSNGQAAQN